MQTYDLIGHLKNAAIFCGLGLLLLGLVWVFLLKVLPFSMRKEIEEDQNIALGIVLGSLILGICIIIAAAIHG